MADKVFLCWIELSGESVPLKNSGAMGAVLICSVMEQSLKDAVESVEKALQEDGYIILEFESVSLFDPEEDYDTEIMELASNATRRSEVNYGLFRAWVEN